MTPSNREPSRISPSAEARRRSLLEPLGTAPFTTSSAMSAGLTHDDLRSHTVTPVMRGVYVAGRDRRVDHGMRCAAALSLAGDEAWVASVDAARLLGLPARTTDRPCVSLPRALRGRRRADMRFIRRSANTISTTARVASTGQVVPVTHPRFLLAECVDELDLLEGVVLADAILRRSTEPDELRDWWRTPMNSRPRVRRIAELARWGADSVMETRTRLLIGFAGFPEPVLQYEVHVGGRRYVLDMAYPSLRIAIEYDGAHHYASEIQKSADIRRQEALEAAGWAYMRVVARGVFQDPVGTLANLERLFADRGHRVTRSGQWRQYFTQRDALDGYRAA